MKFLDQISTLPVLGLLLFFSIFLVASSSIARTCMTSGDKCQRWSNEGFIKASIAMGVIGIVLALIGMFFALRQKTSSSSKSGDQD